MNQEVTEEGRTTEHLAEEAKLAQSLEDSKRTQRTTSALDLLQLVAEKSQQQGYAKQIVEAELDRDTFDQDWRLAKVFALSGAFADIKNVSPQAAVATAMAKIQLGRSWGLAAADSMQHIYFNNGRPSVQNELIAAKLLDAGWNWKLEWQRDGVWGKEQGTVTGCRLWPSHAGTPVKDSSGKPAFIEFSKADADKATIYEKGKTIKLSEKWNYQSWPEDMYYSKCIARLKRRFAANILRGAVSNEEAEDMETPPATAPAAATSNAPQAQAATESKTAKLSEKLKKQSEKEPEPIKVPTVLGKKEGLAVYGDFPPKEVVPNRQKFYVRVNGEDTRYYYEPDTDKFATAPAVFPKASETQQSEQQPDMF